MSLIKWGSSKSMKLTRIIIMIFGISLIIFDLAGVHVASFIHEYAYSITKGTQEKVALIACIYLCSVPAYVVLYSLNKLIRNIEKSRIFIRENVSYLRVVSWCCVIVATICALVGTLVWFSLWIVAIAAGFMALIVRVVKNVFEQAIEMKDELDFVV